MKATNRQRLLRSPRRNLRRLRAVLDRAQTELNDVAMVLADSSVEGVELLMAVQGLASVRNHLSHAQAARRKQLAIVVELRNLGR